MISCLVMLYGILNACQHIIHAEATTLLIQASFRILQIWLRPLRDQSLRVEGDETFARKGICYGDDF